MPDIYSNHLLDDEDNYQRAKPKNYIVNSDMSVSQENGDGPNNAPPGPLYVADQWYTNNSTGTGQIVGSIVELENRDAIRLEATLPVTGTISGTTQAGQCSQILESGNIYGLNGRIVTISLKVRTNWSGNFALAITNQGSNRSYVADLPVTSGVNELTHTLSLESDTVLNKDNTNGIILLFCFNNEGDLQQSSVNNNSWQPGVFVCSDNSTQWTKTAGNFVEITEVQLTEGDVAPKYQPYTDAVYNSYRYFERLGSSASSFVAGYFSGYYRTTTSFRCPISFIRKRSTPLLGFSSQTGFGVIYDNTGTVSTAISNATNSSDFSTQLLITTPAAAASAPGFMEINAGEYIDVNARL